jgi:tRNA-binding EMAP/Myf-like protein
MLTIPLEIFSLFEDGPSEMGTAHTLAFFDTFNTLNPAEIASQISRGIVFQIRFASLSDLAIDADQIADITCSKFDYPAVNS